MPIEACYHKQVRLMVSLLLFLNDEPCFTLKGGSAINLFVQSLPRLSVDIDLAYFPLESRDEALRRCREALQRLAGAFSARLSGVQAELQDNRRDELRILVRRGEPGEGIAGTAWLPASASGRSARTPVAAGPTDQQ